jgi:hypothetical protein
VLVAIAVYPKGALLLFSTAYLVSAPTYYLWSLLRRARARVVAGRRGTAGEGEAADEPAFR